MRAWGAAVGRRLPVSCRLRQHCPLAWAAFLRRRAMAVVARRVAVHWPLQQRLRFVLQA